MKKFLSDKRLPMLLAGMLICLLILTGCEQTDTGSISDRNPNPARFQIWVAGEGIVRSFESTERIPVKIFSEAGILLSNEDTIRWNGINFPVNEPLPEEGAYVLQYQPAITFQLMEDGKEIEMKSTAPTLGRALWENEIELILADDVSMPLNTQLNSDLAVFIRRSVPLTIQVDQMEIKTRSSAFTVGAALAEAGFPLQNLDYCIPAAATPLPEDGNIQIVRVSEEVILTETSLPYQTEQRSDLTRKIGTEWLIQAGIEGKQLARKRIRYEDGEKISEQTENEWVAVFPQNEVVGVGGKAPEPPPPGEDFEYWAAVEMYATSYYPCGFKDRCSYNTASGKTLTKGIVAVTVEWYQALKGYRVYIPGYGYGEIADAGGGIPGKLWIDLGYDNENYVPWSRWVTVYFLPPAPSPIPGFMQ